MSGTISNEHAFFKSHGCAASIVQTAISNLHVCMPENLLQFFATSFGIPPGFPTH
jgi:hypothetical protein